MVFAKRETLRIAVLVLLIAGGFAAKQEISLERGFVGETLDLSAVPSIEVEALPSL
ncbi:MULTISPECIES: hypothetical protein [Shimia]|uniref:hypothetical protein n=1 Tax=Shimia TaxID=573139 RepID=UPI001FB55929|nr:MULTISPECIES: hypothetical protein [Shimia]MDV4146060.1 hypothetical protein [Shimia sp. FJ5]